MKRITVCILAKEDEPEGETMDVELPTRWEICERCDGDGTHVNEAIDGNGITAQEWAENWDDDDREAYLRGEYDVRCTECGGSGKVRVVDLEQIAASSDPDLKRALVEYEEDEQDRASYEAERRAERRMGC